MRTRDLGIVIGNLEPGSDEQWQTATEVLETAGGREPSYEAIPQSTLDTLLRPKRPAGRGNYRGRPQRRNGGFDRERGARVGGGYRGDR